MSARGMPEQKPSGTTRRRHPLTGTATDVILSPVLRPCIPLLAVGVALAMAGCGGSDKPSPGGNATGAPANGSATSAAALMLDTSAKANYPGLQHLHYRFGPVHLAPGQNLIKLDPVD